MEITGDQFPSSEVETTENGLRIKIVGDMEWKAFLFAVCSYAESVGMCRVEASAAAPLLFIETNQLK